MDSGECYCNTWRNTLEKCVFRCCKWQHFWRNNFIGRISTNLVSTPLMHEHIARSLSPALSFSFSFYLFRFRVVCQVQTHFGVVFKIRLIILKTIITFITITFIVYIKFLKVDLDLRTVGRRNLKRGEGGRCVTWTNTLIISDWLLIRIRTLKSTVIFSVFTNNCGESGEGESLPISSTRHYFGIDWRYMKIVEYRAMGTNCPHLGQSVNILFLSAYSYEYRFFISEALKRRFGCWTSPVGTQGVPTSNTYI